MKSDEKLYVIPSEAVLKIREELSDLKVTSSFLLKYYVETREVLAWDDSPIPFLAELYCGSASVNSLLDTLAERPSVEIPDEYLNSLSKEDIVLTNADYVGILTLIESLRTLKATTAMNHGISFEVH